MNRTVVIESRGQTRLETRALENPARGEILLQLRCCGICGTDLFKIDQGPPLDESLLGHELVGTVVALGLGVDSFDLGQRVVTPHHVPCLECHLCRHGRTTLCPVFRENLIDPGGFSDFVIVRARAVEQAARIVPESMIDETAVFLEPAACVLRGIDQAGLPEDGESSGHDLTALILGAGSMGLLHLLVLRSLYPDMRVLLSDPLPERLETALQLGASVAVSPDQLGPQVAESTRDQGADVVFDTVGRPEALRQAIDTTREGASVVLFAHARPGEELSVELNTLFKSERRLVGTYSGGPSEQHRIWQLLSQERLDPSPLVSMHLPLSRFQEGLERIRNRRTLKVLVVPEEETDSGSA